MVRLPRSKKLHNQDPVCFMCLWSNCNFCIHRIAHISFSITNRHICVHFLSNTFKIKCHFWFSNGAICSQQSCQASCAGFLSQRSRSSLPFCRAQQFLFPAPWRLPELITTARTACVSHTILLRRAFFSKQKWNKKRLHQIFQKQIQMLFLIFLNRHGWEIWAPGPDWQRRVRSFNYPFLGMVGSSTHFDEMLIHFDVTSKEHVTFWLKINFSGEVRSLSW